MMKVSAILLVLLPVFAVGGDPFHVDPAREPIPQLVASDRTYSNAVVKKVSGSSVTIEHDSGVETRQLSEFDEANLNRLFPGYLEKKVAAEKARRDAEKQKQQRETETAQLLELRLKEAISAALRTPLHAGSPPLVCILVSARDTYYVSEFPRIAVRIVNRSSNEIYLIGSLDGSADQWRSPLCKYELTDPRGELIPPLGKMCGNMNPMRVADFVPVPADGAFNPFGEGFFSAYPFFRIERPEVGTYRLQFVYSTECNDFSHYLGRYRIPSEEMLQLFQRVPHSKLISNELKITFVKPSR